MTDIIDEINQELKAQQYDKMLKKILPYLIALIVIIMAATACFVWYQNYQTAKAQTEGDHLYGIISSFNPNNYDGTLKQLDAIAQDNGTASSLALILEGAISADQNDIEKAKEFYAKAANSNNEVLADMAKIHELSILMEQDKLDEAAATELKLLTKHSRPWRGQAMLLYGMHLLQKKDSETALSYLNEITEDTTLPNSIRDMAAQLKS